MASQTNAVQKEIPTTVKLSAYLKEAKRGIVVAIVAQTCRDWEFDYTLLFSLEIWLGILESQKRAK